MAPQSKYKPEYCDLLIAHRSNGFSFESFAGRDDVLVNRDTLFEWAKDENKDKYPGWYEAKLKAEDKCRIFWERVGQRMALGLPIIFKDPTTGEDMKSGSYNTAAWIFIMKNMFKWRDRHDVTSEDEKLDQQPIRVILQDPKNITYTNNE